MANSEVVGSLVVAAEVDISQIKKGMAQAGAAVSAFGKSVSEVAGKALAPMDNALKPIETAIEDMRDGLDSGSAATGQLAKAVEKLKGSVNPLGAALDRLNGEMAEADRLFAKNAISATDHAQAISVLQGRIDNNIAIQTRLANAHTGGAKAAGLQSHELLNLGRQFSDIGVTAAMGMNPLMILIQQGPQIAETFSMASARGLTFSAAMRSLAVSTWAALAPLAPFIAAAAAVAAVVGGGLAIAAQQINKDTADLTKGMGLTAEQMERVTQKSVTMGDVVGGIFKVMGEDLNAVFGPHLAKVGKAITDFYQSFVDGAWAGIKIVSGAFVGLFDGVKASLALLAPAVSDLTVSAMNGMIWAIEAALNIIIGKINGMINLANQAAQAVGLTARLPGLAEAALGRLSNPNAGAAGNAGAAFAKAFGEGMNKTGDGLDKWADRVKNAAIGIRKGKIAAQAGRPGKTGSAGGAANDNQSAPEQKALEAVDITDLGKISTSGLDAFVSAFDKSQAEIRAAFAASIRGGLEAGMRGGIPGMMEYLSNSLKSKLLDTLSNNLASIFTRGGPSITGPGSSTGGIIAKVAKIGAAMFGIPGFASGTTYAPGGLALVGERGPELVNLPRGSRVNTASATAGMGGNVIQHFHVNAQGAVLAADLRSEMQVIGIRSAVAGAQGGAMRARQQAQRAGWDRFA